MSMGFMMHSLKVITMLLSVLGSDADVNIVEGTYLAKVHIEGNDNFYNTEVTLKKLNATYFFYFRGDGSTGIRDGNSIIFSTTKQKVCDGLAFSYILKLDFADDNSFTGISRERGVICAAECKSCVSDLYDVKISGKLVKKLDD